MYLPVNAKAKSCQLAKAARQRSRPMTDIQPHRQARLPETVIQRRAGCACGGGCPRCRADREMAEAPDLQAKLKIGAPDDRYEREADRVADQVMRMPADSLPIREGEDQAVQTKPLDERTTPLVQRQAEEEEEELQTKRADGSRGETQAAGLAEDFQQLRGGGEPMSDSLRSYFEPRFGYDFGGVRLHNDARAAAAAEQVNARAFTVGRNVVFGDGQYSPNSIVARSLLAHELTHVLQQTGGEGA
ncbi:MAG: DUF4157 domain-containing protein [Planctomycetes bacterium]|nr:DUF4157 domain-containing protein [Planctomycetota bacterium]